MILYWHTSQIFARVMSQIRLYRYKLNFWYGVDTNFRRERRFSAKTHAHIHARTRTLPCLQSAVHRCAWMFWKYTHQSWRWQHYSSPCLAPPTRDSAQGEGGRRCFSPDNNSPVARAHTHTPLNVWMCTGAELLHRWWWSNVLLIDAVRNLVGATNVAR